MSWRDFYLVCFVLGFALSVVAFLSGTLHLPLGRGLHGLHLPHLHGAAAPGPHAAGHAGDGVSPFNIAGLMAFLAWFGGVGYLLTSRGALPRLIVLILAAIAGIAGALVVFGFLSRFLLRHERPLDPADYVMVGVLGRVTVTIREGGTGEIVYSQEGTRRSAGARSDAGGPIPRGSEVVVTRYERGIAYVRLWEELTNGALSAVGSSPREERSGR